MHILQVLICLNILISAIVFGGNPRAVLQLIISGSVACALSPFILDELKSVLEGKKFGFSPEASHGVVKELQVVCDTVYPSLESYDIKVDPDDNRILECALEAEADIIISGDTHLLALREFKEIRIMTASDFLTEFKNTGFDKV